MYVIRRSGNLLEIPGGAALESVLSSQLTYTHKTIYRGADLYARKRYKEATGADINPQLDLTPTPLYAVEGDRLVCPAGLRGRIESTLTACRIPFQFQDLRSRKWTPMDFDRLKEIPGFLEAAAEGKAFRYRQDEALALIDAAESFVIECPTGWGKSALSRMLCRVCPKANIVLAAPGLDLLKSLYDPLRALVRDVGRIGGGYLETGQRVTLASLDSLHRCNLAKADLLVIDECHELASPSRQAALAGAYTEAKIIGLTASPFRGDGAWDVVEALIGPIALRVTYQEAADAGSVRPLRVLMVQVPPIPGYANAREGVAWERQALWRNEHRNRIIARAVKELVPAKAAVPDPQILVMTSKVDHSYHLRKFLPDFSLVYGSLGDEDRVEELTDLGLWQEGEKPITAADRQNLRKAFEDQTLKYAISTKVWRTGVNFVNLPVMVWAAAGASDIDSVQGPGRLSRIGEVPYGLLVDFEDVFDERAHRLSKARMADYRRMKWPIERVSLSSTPLNLSA